MRITMDLELKDIPGQLVNALAPISDSGGNIVSVVHHHEKRTPRGTIPIQVTFDIAEGLEDLKYRLESRDVAIIRVNEAKLLEHRTVILVGHIIHSDIRDTIDQIDRTGYAEVVDLAMSMPGINLKSSARIGISAAGKAEVKKAMNLLRAIAKDKDLLVIEPIDTEA
ncbi:amino acid-binding protein [Methanocella sp. MCL-LM]|uniref:amino acid-binding protein n=1 Tax=Methanocella sp. MCL-LM TaxID=3412035 RepID=UPI003C75B10C